MKIKLDKPAKLTSQFLTTGEYIGLVKLVEEERKKVSGQEGRQVLKLELEVTDGEYEGVAFRTIIFADTSVGQEQIFALCKSANEAKYGDSDEIEEFDTKAIEGKLVAFSVFEDPFEVEDPETGKVMKKVKTKLEVGRKAFRSVAAATGAEVGEEVGDEGKAEEKAEDKKTEKKAKAGGKKDKAPAKDEKEKEGEADKSSEDDEW